MITQLYEYYMGHVDKLPVEYVLLMVNKGEKKSRVVCDYIAGMSDIYAIDQFEELFVPKRWNVYLSLIHIYVRGQPVHDIRHNHSCGKDTGLRDEG